MRPCTNCGVALEDNMNFCPLCGEPIIDEKTENVEYIEVRKRVQNDKLLTAYQKLSAGQKRKLFWEISGIILFSGMLITFIIDLMRGGDLSWSKYPITACAALLANVTLVSFFPKRTLFQIVGTFVSTSAFLILLDVFSGKMDWGVKLGIPLLFATYVIISILVMMIRRAKEKAFNLIAYTFLASGLLCFCIESIISLYIHNTWKIQWSLVVIASVFPIAAILFFIHYRLRRGSDLRRFFHI